MIQNTGGLTIKIDFVKTVPLSGAGAEAQIINLDYTNPTKFPCGISVSKVWKRINLGYDLLDPNYAYDARIAINPNIMWYMGADESGIGTQQSDLFSAILHESPHFLGFSSAIGSNGLPVQDSMGTIVSGIPI
jgi:hypothetical protein